MSKNKVLELFYKVRELSNIAQAQIEKYDIDVSSVAISHCYKGALGILSVLLGVMTLDEFENYVHSRKVKQ